MTGQRAGGIFGHGLTHALLVSSLLCIPSFGQSAALQPDSVEPGQDAAVASGVLQSESASEPAPEDQAATRVGIDDRVAGLIEANSAYERGDYGRAKALYQELVEGGVVNGHLQYNLGNACLREGELGQAVASYLRASALRPRDQDILANLQFARSQALDALDPPVASPLWRTVAFWHFTLSKRELVLVALVLNFLFWGAMAVRGRFPGSELLRWVCGLLLLALLLVGGSAVWRLVAPDRVAVVTASEIDAMSGFEEGAVVRFKLHAGTELRVGEVRDEYLRVALPTGEQGWVSRTGAELVVR